MQLRQLVIVSVLALIATASLGDQLDEFQNCVKKCDFLSCDSTHRYEFSKKELRLLNKQQFQYELFDDRGLSLWMRLLGWSCYENCDYQCQRIVTKFREQNDEEVYQFHGKWPFLRVLGIQEIFSTAFSIGNFIPHYLGYKKLLREYSQQQTEGFKILYFNYMIIAVVTMGAWIFSTIFHLKDTWNREKLDYFFAGAAVLSGFHAITIRVFRLHSSKHTLKRIGFGLICILLYIYHVTRLTNDWSYTYNMQANVFIGVLQNVLYVTHSINSFLAVIPKDSNPMDYLFDWDYNWTLTPVCLVLCVCFGMSFELFDFPPFFDLLDAHAIWHFVTIWPLFFWYDYMIKDIENLKELKHD